MNNSLSEKSVESSKNRLNLSLCNNEVRLATYSNNPILRYPMQIADDIVAILLNKDEITLNRPIYTRQAVFDPSKLCTYILQFTKLRAYRGGFKSRIDIVTGDTNSFFIQNDNGNPLCYKSQNEMNY